jgi:uncharacterized protein (DUF305 family)
MMRVVLAIGLLVFTAAALATAAPSTAPTDPSVARLSGLSGDAFDVAVLQALIPIDDEAIEMAMTATLYADHTELLRWNQSAVERQNDQIRKMLAWLQAAGASPAERRAGVATESVQKLRKLRGAALEKVYLPLMAAQLDKVSALARLAATKAHRPELRDFAKETVVADNQDTTTLRGWFKRWF